VDDAIIHLKELRRILIRFLILDFGVPPTQTLAIEQPSPAMIAWPGSSRLSGVLSKCNKRIAKKQKQPRQKYRRAHVHVCYRVANKEVKRSSRFQHHASLTKPREIVTNV
jgi:hypothetical protein